MELTPGELRVARIAGRGYSTNRIATDLHLSPRTVEKHLESIYGKLHVTNRDELIEMLRGPAVH